MNEGLNESFENVDAGEVERLRQMERSAVELVGVIGDRDVRGLNQIVTSEDLRQVGDSVNRLRSSAGQDPASVEDLNTRMNDACIVLSQVAKNLSEPRNFRQVVEDTDSLRAMYTFVSQGRDVVVNDRAFFEANPHFNPSMFDSALNNLGYRIQKIESIRY